MHRENVTNLIHCCNCLSCGSWKLAPLCPSSASCTGLSCVPTCHSTRTRQKKKGIVRPRISFRFTVVCLAVAFLLAFPFACTSYPFPSCLALARCPSALTSQGSCAAQRRRRFSVLVSTRSAPAATPHLSPRKQTCHQGRVFTVHLFPSGTWVKNTSLERCCATSTFALVLFLEHSPRFQSKASRNQ